MIVPDRIVTDADGVILNSSTIANNVTQKIVSIFDNSIRINNHLDYRKYMGTESSLKSITKEDSKILRECHRLGMRSKSHLIPLFEDVVSLLGKSNKKVPVITSAYAFGVEKALGEHRNLFSSISGIESGKKSNLLKKEQETSPFYYITDTIKDIERCKNLDISCIAVCWGYDNKETLIKSSPDYIVENVEELKRLFLRFNLIQKS